MPPTWSGCQWVRITWEMEAFSEDKRDFREVSQVGLPSPVSIRRRVGPWPTRYVFVPFVRRIWLVLITFRGGLVGCVFVIPWRVN